MLIRDLELDVVCGRRKLVHQELDVLEAVRGDEDADQTTRGTVDRRCDSDGTLNGRPEDQCPPGSKTGDVISATVWRIGGRASCPGRQSRPPGCTRVLEGDGERTVLAVDARRIVVRTKHNVEIITATGRLLREFPTAADAAALSGKHLALQTAAGIEIYDTDSGGRTARFPRAQLADLEGDILVTASGSTFTLRRLGNGRTTRLHTNGAVAAQLEPPGLFVATSTRVTFTPMKAILRRLGG